MSSSSLTELEDSLWLAFLLSLDFAALQLVLGWLGKNTRWMRLPLKRVKLLESLWLSKGLGSIGSEDGEVVVDLESFVEH